MKSLYIAIILATIAVLGIAIVGSQALSQAMIDDYINPTFDDMDEVSVQEAADKLQTTGPPAVAVYMHRLDSVFGGSHYLLDARGNDVVSGQSLSRYLPKPPLTKARETHQREFVIAHQSADGKYWFVVVGPYHRKDLPFYHYNFLILGTCLLMCGLAAWYVVSPIRRISAGIRQFGEGDLAVRLPVRRRDEIGSLAQSFNGMAERIQTIFLSGQRLLADISHELRSPLARLHFSVKLARTAPDRDAALDRVKRDIDRLTTLVSSLVEIARAEGSAAYRAFEEVSINHLIADTVRDCAVEIEARGGRIHLAAAPGVVVVGSSELLRRAVENVLRNAIRHAPEGTAIDVELGLHAQIATISIRDYGPGVPEEFVEKIFDSFFRTEEARDADSGGVGLGLSIAKRAVQVHRGVIRASNANPGLRVEIELPAEAASFAGETARA
ncbi:periplasmic sensor signal transduction histidine kinase [Candidatus Koribacter versatilis Ellin345]|uniref:histidine kinase n=1 Tax=Koribacter versatilis (strain Ellin345) TaxID=204669 RepID=Q1IHT9_KORVE|nr:ATP-binding protein [Candidatus Koribacter versatilis]ABF43561.1 periplasmic sensor signal transduction histidine kinase [Candidatus Koribacter versatilis Ellin345]